MKKVYLAGGFKSGWQKEVMAMMPGFEFLDPSATGLTDPSDYTKWDLEAIQACDILFAYMEDSNPGGYALGLEVGYARALGKRVVFVNAMTDERRARYFAMVFQCCDAVTESLMEAIEYTLSIRWLDA